MDHEEQKREGSPTIWPGVYKDGRRDRNKSIVWGVFLMALGAAYLCDRLGVIRMPSLGELWPVVFFVIAALNAAEGRWGSATMFVLLGAWFFACEFDWLGLSYRNSWPLVLVAVGTSMVFRALGADGPPRSRPDGRKS
jgi:hypothetical protein